MLRCLRPYRRLNLESLETRDLPSASFIPGQLLVQFRPGATEADKSAVRGRLAAAIEERLSSQTLQSTNDGELDLVALPSGLGVEDAARLLAGNPAVRFAEPNWIVSTQDAANDPNYTNGSLWGMYGDDLPTPSGPTGTTNSYGSQAEKAWAAGYTGSKSVYVGVIDTGVDYTHPDLAANVWTNPGEVPGDGIDNDGDGYVDDVHGYDFVNNDGDPMDDNNHGTHVSGTIGAVGNNAAGVAGINWNVGIIAGKFLNASGSGSIADAIRAVNYFVDLKLNHGVNIVALNNSWSGGGYSQTLHEAIIRAANADILFVAAAGNGNSLGQPYNNDTAPQYPSSYDTTVGTVNVPAASFDSVISVAAIDGSGNKASWSNYGLTSVDLGAPGVGILSTTRNGTYGTMDGTSMATPHVTGAVALYKSIHPDATAAQIRQAILDAATLTPTASLAGKTVTGGRLNIGAFLTPLPPPAPTLSVSDASVTEGNSGTVLANFTVTLSAPATSDVTVNYATANGTATSGSDYTATSGTLTIPVGSTSGTIAVPVIGDLANESNETFFVNLSSPSSNATIADGQGVGTIVNDDGPPTISINNVSRSEGNSGTTAFTFTVSLSAASTQTVTVRYATANGTARTGNNDYVATSGKLTFSPGQTSKTVTVSVVGDTRVETDETFNVNLSSATNATIADGQGVGTILNDDGTGGSGMSIGDGGAAPRPVSLAGLLAPAPAPANGGMGTTTSDPVIQKPGLPADLQLDGVALVTSRKRDRLLGLIDTASGDFADDLSSAVV